MVVPKIEVSMMDSTDGLVIGRLLDRDRGATRKSGCRCLGRGREWQKLSIQTFGRNFFVTAASGWSGRVYWGAGLLTVLPLIATHIAPDLVASVLVRQAAVHL